MITQEELKRLLTYDPETGHFFWNERGAGRRFGNPVGHVEGRTRYRRLLINGKKEMAHRLAWIWMTGETPSHEIDHINHDGSDNRWCNLRAATSNQNKWNRRKSEGKSTPYKGVSRKSSHGRYEATIRRFGKPFYLGTFKTAEEAHEVYKSAALKLHGEYAYP